MIELHEWLVFINSLVWQIIVAVTLIILRHPLTRILTSVTRFKTSGFEAEFHQPIDPEAVAPKETQVPKNGDLHDQFEFLEPTEVETIVKKSGLVAHDDTVEGKELIFETRKQRTWLIATGDRLFCLLDDRRTRQSGKVIQWVLKKGEASTITATVQNGRGRVSIGPRRRWLYSPGRFPTPDAVVDAIQNLVGSPAKHA